MWRDLARATEWKQTTDLASPSLFDVLPARDLRKTSRALARGYFDSTGFANACAARAHTLEGTDLGVRVGSPDAAGEIAAPERGNRVLALYFHQLLAGGDVLLDLRPDRFEDGADGLCWSPKPLWYRFDEVFLDALREIYAGYYGGDDARFEAGLDRLDLRCAEDTFLEHFGGGEAQREVAFDVGTFTDTFHRSFVSCREEGATLHRDFPPLGLYLASLYVHLEQLGGTFDVAAAFDAAARASE